MKYGKFIGKILVFTAVICIMAVGAWGIYRLKHGYALEKFNNEINVTSQQLSKAVLKSSGEYEEEYVKKDTDELVVTKPQANAGGEIITSEPDDDEQGDEEYLTEAVIANADTTEADTTEADTTEAATVVIRETTTAAQKETGTTLSIADIFRMMGHSDTPRGGGTAETTSIDINSITLPSDFPYDELPKPMG